jgi:hypothetical protein
LQLICGWPPPAAEPKTLISIGRQPCYRQAQATAKRGADSSWAAADSRDYGLRGG